MELITVLAWALFCGLVGVLAVRNRETFVLGLWFVLVVPILGSVYRLFAH